MTKHDQTRSTRSGERPAILWAVGALALASAGCHTFGGAGDLPTSSDQNPISVGEPGLPGREVDVETGGPDSIINTPTPRDPGPGDGGEEGSCVGSAEEAETFMLTYCANCHAGGATASLGGFANTLDVRGMIQGGTLRPGEPEASRVYIRTAAGTMPPVGSSPQPKASEVKALENWILCGAPDWGATAPEPPPSTGGNNNPYIDVDTKLRTIYADVRSFRNEVDRTRLRYIDLTPLSNAGLSDEQLELYRQAISFQVNSLSTSLGIKVPEAIDASRTIYRIDIEDYGWTAETWERIAAEYPFAVRYDQDSLLFPFDETTAFLLREEVGTQVPYVQADWFLATVSEAPLYYDLLGFADNFNEFTAQVGIDLVQDVLDEDVVRVGIASSAVALNRNRVTQRHDLPGNQGAIWVSFDFLTNLGESNIFANPLDFVADGSEVIHNLPNGLQAYSIWAGNGDRVNDAPTTLVSDPNDPLGTVSLQQCHVCHGVAGIIPQTDSMRSYVLNNFGGGSTKNTLLALYPDQDEINDLQRRDQELFVSALRRAGVTKDMASTTNTIYRRYETAITAERAAAILDIPVDDLRQALNADPTAFAPQVAVLRRPGGAVQLDGFLTAFADTVRALGLGEPFDPQFSVPDPVEDPVAQDLCPDDPNKLEPGVCGCGVSDADTDGDGALDCQERCPDDPNKLDPGVCGCGDVDTDSDGDGAADCNDRCAGDPAKVEPGECGCGVVDGTCGDDIVSVSAENLPDEGVDKVFDGLSQTQWVAPASDSAFVQVDFAGETLKTVIAYTLISGTGTPENDPRDWTLLGSNDGVNFVTLDTRTGEEFEGRGLARGFTVDNATPFRIYRLAISSNRDPDVADSVQLAELIFLTSD